MGSQFTELLLRKGGNDAQLWLSGQRFSGIRRSASLALPEAEEATSEDPEEDEEGRPDNEEVMFFGEVVASRHLNSNSVNMTPYRLLAKAKDGSFLTSIIRRQSRHTVGREDIVSARSNTGNEHEVQTRMKSGTTGGLSQPIAW